MARRRHHMRGLVRFPGLGRLPSLSSSVKASDVAVGAALGLGGSVGLQLGANKLASGGTAVPQFLLSGSPVVGGLITGAALYIAQRKRNPNRATGHAIGAALAGLAVAGFSALQGAVASAASTSPAAASAAANAATAGYGFQPRVLPAGMGAPLFNNPRQLAGRMGGPIFNNPNVNLAGLARAQGLGDDTEDGMFPAP